MTNVSIVLHKTPEYQLNKVLDSLKSSSVNLIYLIDNSPDDSLKRFAENISNVEYFHVPNDGFGAAHNIAIRKSLESKADYHVVLNPDVYWHGDIVKTMAEYMNNHPETGMISPKIYYPDGDLQYSCRKLPTPLDLFLKRFIPARFIRNRMSKYLLAGHNHDVELNCPYLLGSFLFFRVKALKEKGLFDERFFMYPEDIDITRRIHENWKTLYWPFVKIIHEHQAASRKNLRMMTIHLFNMIKYFNKWGWFFDNKRSQYNSELESKLVIVPKEKREKGRG